MSDLLKALDRSIEGSTTDSWAVRLEERRDGRPRTSKWVVGYKGDHAEGKFELSVVRENDHGAVSWGWPSENKIILNHSGAGRVPVPKRVFDKLYKLAEELRDELNAEEGNNE